jgi:hypothetical protein
MDRTGKTFLRLEWNPNINELCLGVNPNVHFCGLTYQPQVLILMKIYSGHTKMYPMFIPRVLEAPRAVPERT